MMTNDRTTPTNFPAGQLSISEFCCWSGLCKTKVYELIKQGHLHPRKCGRRTLLTMDEALRWRDALPTLHTAAKQDIQKPQGRGRSLQPEISH